MFPTNIKETDIQIGADIDDDVLHKLCRVNKYVKSICPDIWERKLKRLYPDIPIPDKKTAKDQYLAITDSYLKLKEFAEHYNYDTILVWLELPQQWINVLLEFNPVLNAKLFKKRGDMWKYVASTEKELKYYIENKIYPEQRSIDNAFISRNRHYIILLSKYDIYPTKDLIKDEFSKGNIIAKLSSFYQPSQDKINLAVEKGFPGVVDLLDYGYHIDQSSINIAAEKGHAVLIYDLGKRNIFPDQDSINIAAENGFDEIIEILADFGIIS